jgi:hypothetical protein
LTCSHVNELVCLHAWLKKDMRRQDRRDQKRIKKDERFAMLSLMKNEIIEGAAEEEEEEDDGPEELPPSFAALADARLTRARARAMK